MVAKKKLIDLPDKAELKKLCQSLAMLDAIIEPEWEYRYFSFNSKWSAGEMLATMRNGSGDDYFTFFNDCGVIIKGFDHESEMTPFANDETKIWTGVLDEVPREFEAFLHDAAFEGEHTTFCLWRLDSEGVWKTGEIEYPEDDETADGSDSLLFLLDGKPETYCDWAHDYYEQEIDFGTVEKIYRHEPLNQKMVKQLNPERIFAELKQDIEEINYPIS